MILIEQKIVFIHISKNAGTSIVRALDPFATPVSDSIQSQLWQPGPQHSTYREYEKALGTQATDMMFFSVVRNPWDRLVSLFHYWKKSRSAHAHNSTENGTDLSFIAWNGCAFNDWIKLIGTGYCGRHLAPQMDWLCNAHDSLESIEHILRFENLEEPFYEMLSVHGINQVRLKKVNQSEHANYRDYYNESSREIVAERYRRDIQEFGYEF